jgi:hypothetical protein
MLRMSLLVSSAVGMRHSTFAKIAHFLRNHESRVHQAPPRSSSGFLSGRENRRQATARPRRTGDSGVRMLVLDKSNTLFCAALPRETRADERGSPQLGPISLCAPAFRRGLDTSGKAGIYSHARSEILGATGHPALPKRTSVMFNKLCVA